MTLNGWSLCNYNIYDTQYDYNDNMNDTPYRVSDVGFDHKMNDTP